jgi:hypothetical protein
MVKNSSQPNLNPAPSPWQSLPLPQKKTSHQFGSRTGSAPIDETKTIERGCHGWDVLIKDQLPAYITWSHYERNVRQLAGRIIHPNQRQSTWSDSEVSPQTIPSPTY